MSFLPADLRARACTADSVFSLVGRIGACDKCCLVFSLDGGDSVAALQTTESVYTTKPSDVQQADVTIAGSVVNFEKLG